MLWRTNKHATGHTRPLGTKMTSAEPASRCLRLFGPSALHLGDSGILVHRKALWTPWDRKWNGLFRCEPASWKPLPSIRSILVRPGAVRGGNCKATLPARQRCGDHDRHYPRGSRAAAGIHARAIALGHRTLLSKEQSERYDSTRDLYRELRQIRERLSENTNAVQATAAAVALLADSFAVRNQLQDSRCKFTGLGRLDMMVKLLMKSINVSLTIEQVKALLQIGQNQLFRMKYLDPKMPGYRVRQGEFEAAESAIQTLAAALKEGRLEAQSTWETPTRREPVQRVK